MVQKKKIFVTVTILQEEHFITKMISRDKIELIMSNFQSHLSQSYRELLRETHFADVTLVSDDQTQIPGHKIILGAASPVLRNFFLRNSNAKPLIYLRGMNDNILESLLKYIYLGEVQIKYESIKEFMTAARDLKIRELCEEDIADLDDGPRDMEETEEESEEEGDLNCGDVDDTKPVLRASTENDIQTKHPILERNKEKSEPENEGRIAMVAQKMKINVSDLRKKNYNCGVCQKQFLDRTTLRNHNMIKHHI